jgi:hypothetical protein
VLLSIALQHDVPLAVIRGAVTRDGANRPSSVIGLVVDQLFEVVDQTQGVPQKSWRENLKDRVREIVTRELAP